MKKVLRVYPLEKKADEVDSNRIGVNMPAGSVPFEVVSQGRGQFGVAVWQDDVAGVRVWHPMVVALTDEPVLPMLGREYGAPIGLMPLGGMPAVLVPELPWPVAGLGAVDAKGEA